MTHVTRPARPLAAAGRPQPATMPALTIPSRFCGPPGSGNGGYVCGRIAAYLDGPVTVTLRQPPPLATPLAVERADESSVRIPPRPHPDSRGSLLAGQPGAAIPGSVSMAEARDGGLAGATTPIRFLPACFVLRAGAQARGRAADLPRSLWLAGRCGRRRGHRIPRSPTPAEGSGRFVDDAHPAATQFLDDAIMRNGLPNQLI